MRWIASVAVLGACGSERPSILLCGDPQRGPLFERFADVSGTSGLAFHYAAPDFRGGGLAAADLDGDGLPEVLASRRTGGLALFHNLGGMHFAQVTGGDLDPMVAVSAITPVDLDNDGDRDLVLAGPGTAYILENRGDGTFRQVAMLEGPATTEQVLPVDLDRDGLLDLYFVNRDPQRAEGSIDQVFMNLGGLQFALAATGGSGLSWAATAFDFDDDGDQDIYIANDTLIPDFGPAGPIWPTDEQPDQLLRNDGTGGVSARGVVLPLRAPRLSDIASTVGLAAPRSSMGGVLGDFDGDGTLDLFVPNEGAKKLFVREPSGEFVDRAPALGLTAIGRIDGKCASGTTSEDCLLLSWSAAFADFDLDGYDELLVVNGVTGDGILPPALMFVHDPEHGYHEVSPDLGCLDARALVVTDLDGDGDPDVLIAPNTGALAAYENVGAPAPGTWLDVQLQGSASNREGVGAVVTAHLASGRTLIKPVGSGGVMNSWTQAEAFFGLGDDAVTLLEIAWPSGRHSELATPGSGVVHVVEPP
jgi:hypothetical protein